MFIEVTEYLRCPRPHDPEWLVLAPDTMTDRHVRTGTLGCPVCRAEYPIAEGRVRFGAAPPAVAVDPLPPADVVQALLGLESPGGYVALVGSAGMLARGLAPLVEGTHLVSINPPGDPGSAVTVLETAGVLPLRDRVVRGLVLGAECADRAHLAEAHRVVLHGQRVVALSETTPPADGLEEMARGQGLWVGRVQANRLVRE